jgi:hypothetical protein
MSLERSDFAFYDALKAHSTAPDVVARHKAALTLGAKEKLIIVYHNPPLRVPVRDSESESRPKRY